MKDYKKLAVKTTERYTLIIEDDRQGGPEIVLEGDSSEPNRMNSSRYDMPVDKKGKHQNGAETPSLSRGIEGVSELFIASYNGDYPTVKKLLDEGADPNERSFVNWNEFNLAEYSARADELIRRGYDERHLPNELLFRPGEPSLAISLIMNSYSESLLRLGTYYHPEFGITNIYYPTYNDDLRILRLLLEAGADPNETILNGLFPLFVAAEFGHIGAVRLLVGAGADVNKKTPKGATALLNAAEEGQIEVVRYLIAAGADRFIANNVGVTPLMAAQHFGYYDIAEVLQRPTMNQERFYRSVSRTLASLKYYQENYELQTGVYQRLGLTSAGGVINKIENVMEATCKDMGERIDLRTINEKVWALTMCPIEVYDRNDLVAGPLCYLEVLLEDAKDFSTNPAVIRKVEDAYHEFLSIAVVISPMVGGDIDEYIHQNLDTYIKIGITLDHIISEDMPGHSLSFKDYVEYAKDAHQREMNNSA